MNPSYDFHDQVALVTGAAAGMGLDTARAFAAAGAAVVLADVDQEALDRATDELTAAGHRALGVACDVSDEDQVAALVDRTVGAFGRLDTKHGVLGMTKSAALEYAPRGIRINAVCPGTIETPMVARMIADGELSVDDAVAGQPIGRLGRGAEIAASVLWLCSTGASLIVGVALPVDGGYTAR